MSNMSPHFLLGGGRSLLVGYWSIPGGSYPADIGGDRESVAETEAVGRYIQTTGVIQEVGVIMDKWCPTTVDKSCETTEMNMLK